MQKSRLFKIVYYLLEKGRATAPELAEKFEVSVRTIYRDIDAISGAGIPIYAAAGKGGGISILKNFTLDKSLLSRAEQEQILAALQGAAVTYGKNIDELLTKLGGLFQTRAANWIEVDFSGWVQNRPKQEIFNLIKEAIFNKHTITFQYFDSSGKRTDRRVHPYKLVFKSKDWYLYGCCLQRNDSRFFKLTRIKELEILTETFSPVFIPSVVEKQISSGKTIKTKLKFKKQAAFRVCDEFADAVTEDAQGNLYVQTDLPDNEMLYSYILSFGDAVEVLEPGRVREQIRKKLEEIQENYRT